MEQVVSYINREYNLTDAHVFDGDPRVTLWPLMGNMEGVVLLTALYLFVVKYGSAYMASRDPLQVTRLLVLYNVFMVGLSLYMFFEMLACIHYKHFGLLCQPVDYSTSLMGYREASVAWWYFFSKIIEFLDTVFFIVRKKNGQVTFLHVYHHSTMAVICWYVAKYVPGGEKFYAGALNLLVHVVMYSYYGLAAMGPHMHKYLWWKRYLTKFQMAQFLMVNMRSVLSLCVECQYPRWINVFASLYSSSLLLLFADFYLRAYATPGGQPLSASPTCFKVKHPSADSRPHAN